MLKKKTNEIPIIVSDRKYPRLKVRPPQCLKRIHRSNKLLEAVQLPVVLNLNPRSLYNKAEEFKLLIEQTNCKLCFISESWDRVDEGLEEIIEMENFRLIKNPLQRDEQGGKPALFVSRKDFYIKELCPSLFTVPPGVEAVWALLSPKSGGSRSKIRHIAACSF